MSQTAITERNSVEMIIDIVTLSFRFRSLFSRLEEKIFSFKYCLIINPAFISNITSLYSQNCGCSEPRKGHNILRKIKYHMLFKVILLSNRSAENKYL